MSAVNRSVLNDIVQPSVTSEDDAAIIPERSRMDLGSPKAVNAEDINRR